MWWFKDHASFCTLQSTLWVWLIGTVCRPRPCDNEPRLSAPAVSSTGGCQKMDGCSTVVQKMKLLLYTLDPWTSSNSFSFCLVDNFWSTPRSSVLQGSFSEEFFRLGRPCCFYLFLLIFNKKIPTRSTVLLVSSTKCCLRHLDSASARENRDTVFCQVDFFQPFKHLRIVMQSLQHSLSVKQCIV